MKRTRAEFVNLWKHKVGGMALYGVAQSRLPHEERAVNATMIIAEVERLLGVMYDDLSPAKPPANGTLKSREGVKA